MISRRDQFRKCFKRAQSLLLQEVINEVDKELKKDSIGSKNAEDIKSEIISKEENNGTNTKIQSNQTNSKNLKCPTNNETLNEENGKSTDQNVEKNCYDIKMEEANISADSENKNVSEIKQECEIKEENITTSDQVTPEKCTTINNKQNSKRAHSEKYLEEAKRARTMKDGLKYDIDNKDLEYSLTISNMPSSWSFMDIKNFIDLQCGLVDEMEMVKDSTMKGAIRLNYQSEAECKDVMKKLSNKFEGTKYTVTMKVENTSVSEPATPEPPGVTPSPREGLSTPSTEESTLNVGPSLSWRPDLDPWDIDPAGTYRLKESFLKSLNITPPLDRWIHVSNFRCDKQELRDVAELAGRVLRCCMFAASRRFAHIMYTHPLEAVQAVSMLNGQVFYGQTLRVEMMRGLTGTVLLPKALSGVGPGLGSYGRPLRSISEHYKRFVNKETASLNREAFDIESTDDDLIDEDKYQVKPHNVLKDVIEKIETDKSKVDEPVSADRDTKVEVREIQKKKTISKPASPAPQPIQRLNVHNSPGGSGNVPGQGYGSFGPPKPVCSAGPGTNIKPLLGPGPRTVWNGPGHMQRLRAMGPPVPMDSSMRGPMTGPVGGQIPAQMRGQTSGPMQPPIGAPMQGPISMQNMGGPMQNMIGPMQHMCGPMQNMGGSMQNMSGPKQNMSGTMQNMGGSMQNMSGPMQRPMNQGIRGPMPGPVCPIGPQTGPLRPQQGPMVPYKNPNEPVQLQLSNLPPSTTFPLLCDKMAALGQVVSIQLTTPGAAVVTFGNKAQADLCFNTYHNFCVEGYVIQVKYT